jgi:sugar lactone lactonase YvrE
VVGVVGGAGQAYVYDVRTGQELKTYTLTSKETFVNDVVVTDDAAWFTDSLNPVLYRVGIAQGGSLPGPDGVQALQVSGDIAYERGINANGIAAMPGGKTLVIVQSNTGRLFTVDAVSGKTVRLIWAASAWPRATGILLDGSILYVVQNCQNPIAVIRLSSDLRTGTVIRRITDHPDSMSPRRSTSTARSSTRSTPASASPRVQTRRIRSSGYRSNQTSLRSVAQRVSSWRLES